MSGTHATQNGFTFIIFLLVIPFMLSLSTEIKAQGSQTIDRAVALVDSRIITLGEVQQEARTNYLLSFFPEPTTNTLELPENFAGADALNRLIDYRLMLQAARNAGVKIEEAELVSQVEGMIEEDEELYGGRDSYQQQLKQAGLDLAGMKKAYRRRAEEKLLISRFVAAQVAVNRQEVEAYRQQRLDAGLPVELYTLSHLFIICPEISSTEARADAQERAKALHRQLEGGESFAELVAKYSEDIGTRTSGGLMGTLAPNELDPIVLAAVSALEIGQHSEPVRTATGYHIFLLSYKQTARDMLLSQRYQQKQDEILKRLRDKATIEILLKVPNSEPTSVWSIN